MKRLKISNVILALSLVISCCLYSMEIEQEVEQTRAELAKKIIQNAIYNKEERPFLWGAAVAEYQNSGAENCPNSNWTDFEERTHRSGISTIKEGQKSGKSCDSWNNRNRDIEYIKQIGLNSFRFSISWENVEPREGEFNLDAIKYYRDFVLQLKKENIEPMVTLHHFVHPTWFEEKGGFENAENIKYFRRFCKKIFKALSDTVTFWCVINEPNVYAFQGYITGAFPPAKTASFFLAAKVLRNLMEAHTQVYLKLKKMKNGNSAKIGFVHQYLQFKPYGYNPFEWCLSKALTSCFANDVVLNFFKTGEFSPLSGLCLSSPWDYKAPIEGPIADFAGLNVYSRVVIKGVTPSCYSNEKMTDMPYPLCPQALRDGIAAVAKIGLPIYITENGIADRNDTLRQEYFEQYISELSKAINDGYNICGFYYWTLIDNFEWDEGFNMRFGLVELNPKTGETKLRESTKLYSAIIKSAQNQ